MNLKICNVIFFVLCFSLTFYYIPEPIQINFIGGIVGNKLVFYPLIVGFFYTGYCQYRYKKIFVNFNIFIKFLLVYLLINLISVIIGLYTYPYYDLILNGPVNNVEKLQKVITIFKTHDINIDEKFLTMLWIISRPIKSSLTEIVYTFGGAYMIYCWYYKNWQLGFRILVLGILSSFTIIFSYCIIELFYLAGNDTAKNVLEIITPYFHIIKSDGTWWPPLLWKSQLRSVFPEPAYFGAYFSFAMPILWYITLKNKSLIKSLMLYFSIIFFTFCLFLTQSRTTVVLFIGQIFIFILFLIYLHNKIIIKKSINILMCSILAFGCANYFISTILVYNKYGITTSSEYVKSNIASITSTEQRSNNARYSIMMADFKIGLDNPFFGIGKELRNSYIPDYLPEMSRNNEEVKMWLKNQKEKGILSAGFPKLGEYTSRFSETGILGLMMFLIPPIFLLVNLYNKITDKNILINDKIAFIFYIISLIGSMAFGIGDSINTTYCYWLLLGLGYTICFGKRNGI